MRLVLAAPFLLQLACVPQSQPPSGKDASAPDAAGVDAGLPDAAVAPSVVVATFNVRRFFDPVCESGSCAPEDYEALPTQQQFLAKADQLAAALRELNADVVMLQEIETQLCLDALQSALDGGYPVAILGETGASASVDVAVLARGDWLESRRHRGMPLLRADGGATVFSRELLEIHLQRDGVRVVAFAAHFRSKSNDDPERRLLEAQVSHAVIRATAHEHPDALVLLGGDLNDTPGSEPINALEAGGHLHRAASQLPSDAAATYTFFDERLALDHLFVSLEAGGELVPGSVFVHGGGQGFGGSDHSALSARFRLQR